MGKNRLEAFSDGVLAIIITIMVLELRVPHDASLAALQPLWGVFLSYVLSFVYLGIYWNNHHHLLHTTDKVTGGIRSQGANSLLRRAVGPDWKGKLSPVLYVVGILAALVGPYFAVLIYWCVAVWWLVPDKRIERVLRA